MLSRSRGSRNNRSRNSPRPSEQLLRTLNDTLHDLIDKTEVKALPAVKDVQPIKMSHRPKVHTFQVKVNKGYATVDVTGDQGALAFSLADVPSPTDFTSLFDQYRISQVTVEFLPLTTSFGPSTTATDLPYMITCIDYDDNSAAPYTTLEQYGNAQAITNQTYTKRTLNPKFALSAYSGVFGSFSQSTPGMWIDSNSPSVQYYGVKWATTPVSVVSGTYNLYAISATYTIQCRNNI